MAILDIHTKFQQNPLSGSKVMEGTLLQKLTLKRRTRKKKFNNKIRLANFQILPLEFSDFSNFSHPNKLYICKSFLIDFNFFHLEICFFKTIIRSYVCTLSFKL
uniref:Uncharacterized protein n=1 Tax=Cacopsylla melanoneura TaxID=428564 RepID=A0A8D8VB32_9HEMI